MNELYLMNKLVDLSEDISVSFCYTATELDTPTAERNSFSKSVDIQGTPTNNKIFNDIFQLDYNVSNYNFNPRVRNDFELWSNGEIVERGYFQLDEINVNNNDITYSITLYGGLGDFFYNLQYDDEGEDRTLETLYYGFKSPTTGNILTKEEEETTVLFSWDKDYITDSWHNIEGYDGLDYTNGIEPMDVITAAPCYGGTYDDFDNTKVLVEYSSLSETAQKNIMARRPQDKYAAYKDYLLTEATRDLDEWETRDLRSQFQRPAIRQKFILDAICNPDNNGGYEVVWDDEILDSTTTLSKYYYKSWLVKDRLAFDEDENANTTSNVDWTGCNIGRNGSSTEYITANSVNIFDATNTSVTVFDTSNTIEPKLEVNVRGDLHLNFNLKTTKLYSSFKDTFYVTSAEGNTQEKKKDWVIGGFLVRFDVYTDDVYHSSSNNYFITSDVANCEWKDLEDKIPNWKDYIAQKAGIDDASTIVKVDNEFVPTGGTICGYFKYNQPVNIVVDLPISSNVSIKVNYTYVSCSYLSEVTGERKASFGLCSQENNGYMNGYSYWAWVDVYNDDEGNYINAIYDNILPDLQATQVTKKILFGSSETPYDYLIGFTKILGLKFRSDVAEKKIYIEQRKNYFTGDIYDLTDKIDRSQEIKITPTLTEYKWYLYGLETPETYASQLYLKKNKLDYGSYKVDTGYYFNNDTNELFEDVVYQNIIPYKLNSIYFNTTLSQAPSIMLSPTYDVSYFDIKDLTASGLTNETATNYGEATISKLKNVYDDAPRLCSFDSDDGAVDSDNCLLFFDGYHTPANETWVSDAFNLMKIINEGNPCFFYSSNGKGYIEQNVNEKSVIANKATTIPVFNKYITNSNGIYTDSFDFKKPNSTFIGDIVNYQDGITIYDRYWKDYIEDIYDINSKSVECYAFVNGQPNDILRHFYYFDNGLWVANEIEDYNPDSKDLKHIIFVKVKDASNYTDKELVWHKDYSKFGIIEGITISGSKKQQKRATNYVIITYTNGTTETYYYSDGIVPNAEFSGQTDIVDVVVGDGITEIGESAFQYCTSLTGISIPDSVSAINGWTFQGCTSLSSITLPDSIATIGNYVFQGCTALTGITIPSCVSTIGFLAFADCTSLKYLKINDGVTSFSTATFASCSSLTDVVIPDSITDLPYRCFADCSSLTSVTIPDSVTNIGTQAFCACSSLTSITIPDSVTSIGDYAFKYCYNLTSITIPDSVKSIGEDAFANCTALTSVTLSEGLETLSRGTFYNCGFSAITLPDTLTSLGTQGAFDSCYNLVSINIPEGITDIPYVCFKQCPFSSITLPNTLTTIGEWAFQYCSNLTGITIPSSVTSMGKDVFVDCTSLTTIVCKGESAPSIECDTFWQIATGGTLYYPSGSDYSQWLSTDELYLGYYGWTGQVKLPYVTLTFADGTTHTNYYENGISTSWEMLPSGYAMSDIVDVVVGNGITTISDGNFYSGTSLTSITIPNSVTSIGNHTFELCTSLTSINIPDSVTSIGRDAFCQCTSLTGITIGSGLTSIPYGAFELCTSLTSITIPNSVTSIENRAFCQCTSLVAIDACNSTPPTIHSDTFYIVATGGTLYIPSGANYSTWMGNGGYYLGYYDWTSASL